MKCKSIRIENFRNIKSAFIRFDDGMNVFLGENAQGKTNALEAIYLFARGKSFRGATDGEMTCFTEDHYTLELTYEKQDREETLFFGCAGKEKARKKNGVPLSRQSELIGNFRAVLFCPDHLQMVKGAPSERRRFLDIAISQCYPVYLSLYNRYVKNLEQRNSLLHLMQKGMYVEENELAVFGDGLAEAAGEIAIYRKRYVERLGKVADRILYDLSGGREHLCVKYCPDLPEGITDPAAAIAAYREIYKNNIYKESCAGTTLYGIHRDELELSVNGVSARDYGSQGQQRSIVLALKMAEGELSGEICGEPPVYLLDDVLSELDEERRKYLLSGINGRQFIVTGCEKSILGEHPARIIPVKDGKFGEEGTTGDAF